MPNWYCSSVEIRARSGASWTVWGNSPGGRAAKKAWSRRTNSSLVWGSAPARFPVWDLGGLLGSTLWGLWVIALGVAVLRGPFYRPTTAAVPARSDTRS